jgi:hypothetical protein
MHQDLRKKHTRIFRKLSSKSLPRRDSKSTILNKKFHRKLMKKMKLKPKRKGLRLKNKKKRESNKRKLQLVKKLRSLLLKRQRSQLLSRMATMKSPLSREIILTKTSDRFSSSSGTTFQATTRPRSIRFSRESETRGSVRWSTYRILKKNF